MDKRKGQEDQFEMNPEFERGIKAIFKGPGAVGREVDEKIEAAAQKHFARYNRRVMITRTVKWAAGIAAALLLTAVLYTQVISTKSEYRISKSETNLNYQMTNEQNKAMPAGDINGDGIVDIRDAFAIARGIENHGQSSAMDINGDGVIDKRDVDATAMLAVKL